MKTTFEDNAHFAIVQGFIANFWQHLAYLHFTNNHITKWNRKTFRKHHRDATFHVTFKESIPAANSNADKLSKDIKGEVATSTDKTKSIRKNYNH